MIVVSEIFGLHEHIADVARRFAKQGYLAVAPELFIRQAAPIVTGYFSPLRPRWPQRVATLSFRLRATRHLESAARQHGYHSVQIDRYTNNFPSLKH